MAFSWPLDGTIRLYSTMLLLILHKRIMYHYKDENERLLLQESVHRTLKARACMFITSFFTAGSIIFQKKEITVLHMMEWNHF